MKHQIMCTVKLLVTHPLKLLASSYKTSQIQSLEMGYVGKTAIS